MGSRDKYRNKLGSKIVLQDKKTITESKTLSEDTHQIEKAKLDLKRDQARYAQYLKQREAKRIPLEERYAKPVEEKPFTKPIPLSQQPLVEAKFEAESLPEISPDQMERYLSVIKDSKTSTGESALQASLYEQDLQNTPASLADLQKLSRDAKASDAELWTRVQTSLTSLGGGGLGDQDVLKLIRDNSTDLSDSDLDYIASQIDDEFTDSAEVLILINDRVPQIVDSAYVNALVDINTSLDSADYQEIADRVGGDFLDSAEALSLVQPIIDSAISDFIPEDEVVRLIDSAIVDFIPEDEVARLIDSATQNFIVDSDINDKIDFKVNTHYTSKDHHDSNAVRGFVTAGHINPMIEAHVDSAYIIDRTQWVDSVIVSTIGNMVDSAYVEDRSYFSISHLTDVDTVGAAVDDFLIFDGVNWVHSQSQQIDAGLLDFKGTVDVTALNSAPDVNDVSDLPYHGDVYVADAAGIVDASWAGAAGDSVSPQDILLFDSNAGDGSLGSGLWTHLGAAGGTTSISEIRPGYGIGVNSVQPSKPIVSVDSDQLATKFLRLSDEGKEVEASLVIKSSSDNRVAALKLYGRRPNNSNNAGVIEFKNNQDPSGAAGFLGYKSGSAGNKFNFTEEVEVKNKLTITGNSAKEIVASGNPRMNISSGRVFFNPNEPGNTPGRGFTVGGKDDTDTDYVSGLLSVYHNTGGHDAINYYGKSDSPNNIMNRTGIEAFIDEKLALASQDPAGMVYEFTTNGSAADGQFRVFTGGAHQIQISAEDYYGRTSPNHTEYNGFHCTPEPWVTLQEEDTGIIVFGAQLKWGHPYYAFKERRFYYNTADIQKDPSLSLDASNLPILTNGKRYVIKCAGII